MTQGFLRSIFGLALLAALLVATALNIWQTDRLERRVIDLSDRVGAVEGGTGAVRVSGTPERVAGEPDYIQAAYADPANLVVRQVPYLPDGAPRGGLLRLKLGQDPKGLNFLVENGNDTTEIKAYTTLNLLSYHRLDTSKFAGELAYHVSTPDAGKTYVFKLRQDIVWHEPAVDWTTGRYEWLRGEHRVTARDVVFMLDLLMNPQVAGAAPLRSYFEGHVSHRAIDDYTVELVFQEPKFSQWMILQDIFPVPEFLYAFDESGVRYDASVLGQRFQDHWYNPKALGCGPYRFVAYEPGVKIELERAPRFPLGGDAHDRIIFEILKDQSSWARKLRTKELHLSQLQPGQYRSEVLEGGPESPFNNGQLQRGEYWEHSWFYIGWNAEKPWFKDRRVRWAMSHAFPAQRLLEEVFMGLGELTTGPMPAFLPFYDKSIPAVPFDLARAAALLDEAGWKDSNGDGIRDQQVGGTHVEFDFTLLVYGSSDEYKTLGNIYKEELAKIGIKMTVRPADWAVQLKMIDDREFDATTMAWVGSPDVDFFQIWHSSQADVPKGSNRVGFKNAAADVLIEKLQREFAYGERVRLAKEFHKLLYDEQPYTFFFTRKRVAFWQPELQNVSFSPTRPYMNPRPWFLARTGP
jgi:ABC-type transport system substrate-binding protein